MIRKQAYCRNCHYVYHQGQPDSYCPQCGQANNDRKISVWVLLKEVFDSYISVDSKLLRSMGAALLLPGQLTRAFAKGQLVRYVSPIRLYFFSGFIYFAIFSSQAIRSTQEQLSKINLTENMVADTTITPGSLNHIVSSNETEGNGIAMATTDFDTAIVHRAFENSSNLDSLHRKKRDKGFNLYWGDEAVVKPDQDLDQMISVLGRNTNPQVVADSLLAQGNFWLTTPVLNIAAKQGIKLYYSGVKDLIQYFVGLLPIMILLMIPLFAFVFKVLYIRNGCFYVEHTVFFLHYHAFLYLLFAIFILCRGYQYPAVVGIVMLSIWLYLIVAVKKVYEQGWFKTLLKSSVIIFLYPVIFASYLVVTLIASFLLF